MFMVMSRMPLGYTGPGPAIPTLGNAVGIRLQPRSEFALGNLPCGKIEEHADCLRFRCCQPITVQAQENVARHERHALVAVNEWMVPRNSPGVRGGKLKNGTTCVANPMAGPCQSGLEEACIANPGRTAVLGDEFHVHGDDDLRRQPLHFASALSALR